MGFLHPPELHKYNQPHADHKHYHLERLHVYKYFKDLNNTKLQNQQEVRKDNDKRSALCAHVRAITISTRTESCGLCKHLEFVSVIFNMTNRDAERILFLFDQSRNMKEGM